MTFFRGGTPLRRPRSRGTPAPSGTKFCHDKLDTLGQPTVKNEDFVILACTVLIQITSVTDGRTDRRPDDGKDARSILLSRVKNAEPSLYTIKLSPL